MALRSETLLCAARRAALRMRTLLPALALLTLAACTSTSLLEQWRDPGYAGPPVERLMVVSVERSDGRRRMFEDAMAGTLTRHGVRAEPSYRMLPDSIPEREALSAMARSSGYDGVLMLHSLGTSQSTHYSPGSIQYYPAIRPTLDGKYREYWQAVFQPGASQVEQQLDYQTDLFSAGSGALIWSAASRSIDLTSAQSITMDIANRVVPELRRTGLLRTSP